MSARVLARECLYEHVHACIFAVCECTCARMILLKQSDTNNFSESNMLQLDEYRA